MRRFAAVSCFVALIAVPGTAFAQVTVLSGPTLTMDPNGQTPLAGVIELETDTPVRVKLSITDGGDSWTVDLPPVAQQHDVPVLGLKAGRTYTVTVRMVPGGTAGTVFATTPPLPADFPVIVAAVSDPNSMEPGYTLTNCLNRANTDPLPEYSAIVDHTGEVVWYTTRCLSNARYLPTGEILHRVLNDAVHMDLLGNETRVALAFPGVGSHHELMRTPHGTYLSMDAQEVPVESFPTSETDPLAPWAPAILLDDSIVEFLPDGTLRREWPTLDMVDVTRIGYDSLRLIDETSYDWTHGNAAHYRIDDDSIVTSLRQQDAVVKFSRETGDVEWIMAPHDNWSGPYQQYLLTPVGSPFRWQFHQHAPMWTAPNRVVLYDNGNHRASPFDGNVKVPNDQNFSRGVEYEIDEVNMTIQQVWEYGENIADPLFTAFIGDGDWLETTGNRLMTFGAVSYVGGVASTDLGLGSLHARLVETTDDVVPVKVWELLIYDPAERITVYRSERIPDLYPTVYFQPPNGVGNTLVVEKGAGQETLSWALSPVDATHDAAEHYRVYTSASAGSGFTMLDSTANVPLQTDAGAGTVTFIKVVAANLGGTSGDEPNP